MPCLPRKDPNIIEPKETQQWKHVDRYGETKIRYASRGLKARPKSAQSLPPRRNIPQKASNNDPVQEYEAPTSNKLAPLRPRPVSASEEHYYHSLEEPRQQDVTTLSPSGKPVHRQVQPPEIYDIDDSYVNERPQKKEAVQHHAKSEPEDVYISVPIFTEKLNHSMKHKNTYIYKDSHVMSDSTSVASSMPHRSQRPSDKLKPQPWSLSAQPGLLHHSSTGSMNTYSHYSVPFEKPPAYHNPASEISFRTNQSSTGSVYDVEFNPSCTLKKTRHFNGIIIDSDDEDYR